MSISHIPRGFHSVTPYFLIEDGDLFADFLKKAFDAEVIDDHREKGRLVHGAYRIFGSIVESGETGERFLPREMAMHLYVEDCDEVYEKALAAGGVSIHEVMDMPYGERSGGVKDPCGNHWYIATQMMDMYPDNDQGVNDQ
ncbi:MAG: VOC family protein [Acidobacteriota bacterium]|nr:MAG: VOC family protein [Acidobacteriota bacterium]